MIVCVYVLGGGGGINGYEVGLISAKCTIVVDNGQTTLIMPIVPNYGPKCNPAPPQI